MSSYTAYIVEHTHNLDTINCKAFAKAVTEAIQCDF